MIHRGAGLQESRSRAKVKGECRRRRSDRRQLVLPKPEIQWAEAVRFPALLRLFTHG